MQHLATENNYMAELNNMSIKLKPHKFFMGNPSQNCRVWLAMGSHNVTSTDYCGLEPNSRVTDSYDLWLLSFRHCHCAIALQLKTLTVALVLNTLCCSHVQSVHRLNLLTSKVKRWTFTVNSPQRQLALVNNLNQCQVALLVNQLVPGKHRKRWCQLKLEL